MLVVLDTNILVSSLFSPLGNETAVVKLVALRDIFAAVSIDTLSEYEDVLTRAKFDFAASRAREVLNLMLTLSVRVIPTHRLAIFPDESDNRFLECAAAARADFLITGNRRHFPASHKTTRIVNAREFLDALA